MSAFQLRLVKITVERQNVSQKNVLNIKAGFHEIICLLFQLCHFFPHFWSGYRNSCDTYNLLVLWRNLTTTYADSGNRFFIAFPDKYNACKLTAKSCNLTVWIKWMSSAVTLHFLLHQMCSSLSTWFRNSTMSNVRMNRICLNLIAPQMWKLENALMVFQSNWHLQNSKQ